MTTKFTNNAFATLSAGINNSTNTIALTGGQGARFPTLNSSVITVTIAAPGVVTWTAHGFVANQAVIFTTTAALPTGITAGQVYYVMATGLTTNTFQISTSIGGSAVNTTGSQSGVHTGSSDWFWATLVNASNVLEIVRVVARATDTLTAIRGQDGTTGQAYLAADRLELRPVAGAMGDKLDLNQANTAFAPVASPTFTGVPAAPTAAGGTNTTQLATTAFVAGGFGTIASVTSASQTVANSGADTTPGNLAAKVVAGAGISLTTLNPAANEQMQVASVMGAQTGMVFDYTGFTIPSGYLNCDGTPVSRTVYANLFAALAASTVGNTTVSSNTISNIPSTAGWAPGMPVSGAGIPANTLILTVPDSTHITITQNAGSSNTGGALVVAPWGIGDGATTFNVPDLRDRSTIGDGTGVVTETIVGVTASASAVTVASNANKWITGMAVTVTGASSFTGLVNGSYFVIRVSSTQIQFATTLANAQNGTQFAVSGTGNATFTTTLTTRTLGLNGGEDAHAIDHDNELPLHTHTQNAHSHTAPMQAIQNVVGAGSTIFQTGSTTATSSVIATNQNTGGNAAMNIMSPYAVVKKIVKT